MVTFVPLFPGINRPLNYLFVELTVNTSQGLAEKFCKSKWQEPVPGAEILLVELERTWEMTEPSGPLPGCTPASPEQYGKIPVPRPYPGPLLEWSLGISIF